MAGELNSLTSGFDQTHDFQNLLYEIKVYRYQIEAFVDYKTVFEIIPKQGRTD